MPYLLAEIQFYCNEIHLYHDENIDESQKRFSLAHELGHIIMHGDKEASFTDDDTTLEGYKNGPQEKEANDFARDWLLPNTFLDEIVNLGFMNV
ncbi:MAG: ImmA/IrrE family metallo-endopeptidase [Sphingobacteriales bacterium]|nr:MAG: ImmA/IrrE family metallo-endopeptidase [Sphingobacteriales bacterium]